MNGRPPVIYVLPWPSTVRVPASCLPFDPDDEPDDISTEALLFANASVEFADHLTTCDACGDRTGPLCLIGEMRVDVLLDLGTAIKARWVGRGWI